MQGEVATLTGQLPADLGNEISDAIYGAVGKGMEVDEAVCVALKVAADYGRQAYGDDYRHKMADLLNSAEFSETLSDAGGDDAGS